MDWATFGSLLNAMPQKQRKSNAWRKPHDVTLMFKMLVLQALYNLSDDQTEFQMRNRLSFQRFLGLLPEDAVPDAKTLWLFREQLTLHGLIHKLFRCFGITDASVHDSQVFDELLDAENSDRSNWADSAYRSEAREDPRPCRACFW